MGKFREVTSKFSASPQIDLDDVERAATQGFKAIICNRPDDEDNGQLSGKDVAASCARHGIQFTHIPVSGGMSQVQVEQMARAIDAAGGPVLAYCRSGTRSTNLWALAMAGEGLSGADLVEAAAGAGYDLSSLLPSLNAITQRS